MADTKRTRPNYAACQGPTQPIVDIATRVFAGHGSLRDVARFTGISHETVRTWLHKGRAGDERYVEFARACDEALTTAKMSALAKVEERDPKWLLVVRHKMKDTAPAAPASVTNVYQFLALPQEERARLLPEISRRLSAPKGDE